MSSPTIGVLALQGDVREHAVALAEAALWPRPVRRRGARRASTPWSSPAASPRRCRKLAVSFGLFEPAARAASRRACRCTGRARGMIMLADKHPRRPRATRRRVGGIDMTVRRNAFGRQNRVVRGGHRLHSFADRPLHGVFIRASGSSPVGAGVEVLATLESAPTRARVVAVRQGNLLATSVPPRADRRRPRPRVLRGPGPRRGVTAPGSVGSCRGLQARTSS
ncbi:pyridoxal 5'-phosphate synthase glutaminase subunit PdxT [Yinghuangia aomiensis]